MHSPSPRRASKTARSSVSVRRSRTRKVSITVDDAVLREAIATAKKEGRTLSAQITEDLAEAGRRRNLAAFLSKYEAEHGLITETELAVARKKWPI